MSEHLKRAQKALNDGAWKVTQEKVRYQNLAIWDLIEAVTDLEAQQETPASEPSSAPTTGRVIRHYGSAIASLDTNRVPFLLTVGTGDCSSSISFTPDEWAATLALFSTLIPTSGSLIRSTGTQAAGGRGHAALEPSPAPSHEAKECTCRWVPAMGRDLSAKCARHDPSPSQSYQEGAQD